MSPRMSGRRRSNGYALHVFMSDSERKDAREDRSRQGVTEIHY